MNLYVHACICKNSIHTPSARTHPHTQCVHFYFLIFTLFRDSYPYDHQFQIITKYITDNTQSPSIKMKVKLLQYLTGLISLMDASDFINTALIRLAVSRIVTWISEPKSPEVRKVGYFENHNII